MMKLLLNNPMFSQSMPPPGGGASLGGERGASGDSSSNDLNSLAEKINKQLWGRVSGNQQPGEEEVAIPDTSIWKWKLLRIVSVVSVLGYLWSQLEDYHFSRNVDITNGIVPFCLCTGLI
jgi:hypothetical protein